MCLTSLIGIKDVPESKPLKAYKAFLVRREDGRLIPISHTGQDEYSHYVKGTNHAPRGSEGFYEDKGFYVYNSKSQVKANSGTYHVIAEVTVHGDDTQVFRNGCIAHHLTLKKIWVAQRPLKDSVTEADLDKWAKKIKQTYGVPVVRGRP